MDFELPEDIRLLRETVRKFVDRELIPIEMHSMEGPDLKPEFKTSLEAKAREIALKQAPGTVKSSELEKEKGTLVWSFDITNAKGGGITEVLVSAIDGHIVETKAETAKDEAKEKAQEAKEAKAKHKTTKTTTHH